MFKYLETSVSVTVNGHTHILTEADIDRLFCETAELYDTDHEGPAAVTLGSATEPVTEKEWQALYAATEAHIQNDFELNEETITFH